MSAARIHWLRHLQRGAGSTACACRPTDRAPVYEAGNRGSIPCRRARLATSKRPGVPYRPVRDSQLTSVKGEHARLAQGRAAALQAVGSGFKSLIGHCGCRPMAGHRVVSPRMPVQIRSVAPAGYSRGQRERSVKPLASRPALVRIQHLPPRACRSMDRMTAPEAVDGGSTPLRRAHGARLADAGYGLQSRNSGV